MANLTNCMQSGLVKAQSEPVPAACINKQHSSGSPSSSLPSDKLYRHQLLLTTKLGKLDAFQTHTFKGGGIFFFFFFFF